MTNPLNLTPAKSPYFVTVSGYNKLIALINQFDANERTNINLVTGCAIATSRLLKQNVILKQDTSSIARIFPNGHIEWQAYTGDSSQLFDNNVTSNIAKQFEEMITPKRIDDNSLESAMNKLFSI